MTKRTLSAFECVVSADLVRRALFGVSTEEARYYLNGVHISAAPEGGVVVTATDGHLLISLHDPDGIVSGDCILSLNKQMKAALSVTGVMLDKRLLLARSVGCSGRAFVADIKAKSKGDSDDYSPHREALALFDEPDGRIRAAQFGAIGIDGQYPNWRRVVPDDLRPDAAIPALDHTLVQRVAQALTPNKTARTLHMVASGETPASSPVFVTSMQTAAPAGFAVVMPVRGDGKAASIPAWARRTDQPMAAE